MDTQRPDDIEFDVTTGGFGIRALVPCDELENNPEAVRRWLMEESVRQFALIGAGECRIWMLDPETDHWRLPPWEYR